MSSITHTASLAHRQIHNQEEVFNESCKQLIKEVYSGINGTIFAYGATGSGKTYTMIGARDKPGVIPRSVAFLYSLRQEHCIIKLSYYEIYNEVIRDLLSEHENLEIREDPIKGVTIADLKEHEIHGLGDFQKYLIDGTVRRTQESTFANLESSRSHAIIQVMLQRKLSVKEKEIRTAKLYLIDLAGSERAIETKNKGIRLKEGANINKSLLSLGNCINALCSSTKNPHVPYRDSKLTRILKESLGGNCRTLMIATISSSIKAFDDTYNTLKYATRAKSIRGNVKVNVMNEKATVDSYLKQIQILKEQLQGLTAAAEKGPSTTLDPLEKIIQKIDKHFTYEHNLYSKLAKVIFNIATIKLDLTLKNNSEENCKEEDTAKKADMVKLEKEEKILTEAASIALQTRNQLIEEANGFSNNKLSLRIARNQLNTQTELVEEKKELANYYKDYVKMYCLHHVKSEDTLPLISNKVSYESPPNKTNNMKKLSLFRNEKKNTGVLPLLRLNNSVEDIPSQNKTPVVKYSAKKA